MDDRQERLAALYQDDERDEAEIRAFLRRNGAVSSLGTLSSVEIRTEVERNGPVGMIGEGRHQVHRQARDVGIPDQKKKARRAKASAGRKANVRRYR